MNLTEVLLQDGKVIHKKVDTSFETFDLPMGSFRIENRTPLDLTVANDGKKVLLFSGNISFDVWIPCDRCLEPVLTHLDLSIDEKVDMKLSDEARIEALDESSFLHGYNLDVDELVTGAAMLEWPVRTLCREDCKGLCKVCGQNLNRKTCDCDRTDFDPRMAKIRDIFSNFKEVNDRVNLSEK